MESGIEDSGAKKEEAPSSVKAHEYKSGAHWAKILADEFSKETDRGAAILATSLLDNSLRSLLYNYLVPNPNKKDDLFDGATAPLSSYSARISMSYRSGLISQKLSRDLHLIRKIRNEFAHNIQGASFSSSAIRNRILELTKSHGISERSPKFRAWFPEGDRGEFLISVSWILWELNDKTDSCKSVPECDLESGYTAVVEV